MKVIFCPECTDLFNLSVASLRRCSCGKSWGQYKGKMQATYGGEAIPIGISDNSFMEAMNNRGQLNSDFEERVFKSFFVKADSYNFTHENNLSNEKR